ncbi:UNVERIFIED_ORG: hypothetical protein GGI57_006078, partial [Rhizobium aethiopicum]
EVRVQNPRMTRIPVAQPHYTATATYKDEALLNVGLAAWEVIGVPTTTTETG